MLLQYISKKKVLLLTGDALIITCTYFVAPVIRFGILLLDASPGNMGGLLVLLVAFLVCFYVGDLYSFEMRAFSAHYAFRFVGFFALAYGLAAGLFFFFSAFAVGRGIFFISSTMAGVAMYCWRLALGAVFARKIRKMRATLIVGAGRTGVEVCNWLKDSPIFRVIGSIDDDSCERQLADRVANVLGGPEKLKELVSRADVDQIIIATRHITNPDLLKHIVECKMGGIAVHGVAEFYEAVFGKIYVEHLSDERLIDLPIAGARRNLYNKRLKRMIGILFSLVGLVLSGPFFPVLAALIKLDSKGPVFYRQLRVGLNGEPFELIKYRSMSIDAEKNGAVWASEGDDRATKVGKIIRKLRIDEIPQLWNVLRGDMNMFGPRPERPEFVRVLEEKIPYYSLRHIVKPGITGWAQVNYPYGASEKDALEKLKYDLFYVKNVSPLLDFHILMRTMRVIIWGQGAR